MRIENDEWELFKDSPYGELLFRALRKEAERAKQAWVKASWEAGRCDPLVLAALKERARLATDLSELSAEQLEDMLDEQD